MAVKRVAFKVHGEVQGVNFRNFTQRKANVYGVIGWVQNTSDGKVAGEVQGEEESVQKLLKDIDKGPRLAHVVKLEQNDISTQEGESSFVIRR